MKPSIVLYRFLRIKLRFLGSVFKCASIVIISKLNNNLDAQLAVMRWYWTAMEFMGFKETYWSKILLIFINHKNETIASRKWR